MASPAPTSPTSPSLADETLLQTAIGHNHLDTVRLYLTVSERSPLVLINSTGQTPLHHALLHPNPSLEMVAMLLSHPSSDINAIDREKMSPLHLACKGAHTEILTLMVAHHTFNPKITVEFAGERIPFLCAAYASGWEEGVRFLYDLQGIDWDIEESNNPNMLLRAACGSRDSLLFSKILSRTDVNLRRTKKDKKLPDYPLPFFALDNYNSSIFKMIVDHPTFDPMVELDGESLIHHLDSSSKFRDEDEADAICAYKLITSHPKANLRGLFRHTPPLIFAICRRFMNVTFFQKVVISTELFVYFLSLPNVDVNAKDNHGLDALQNARDYDADEEMQMLFDDARTIIPVDMKAHLLEVDRDNADNDLMKTDFLLVRRGFYEEGFQRELASDQEDD